MSTIRFHLTNNMDSMPREELVVTVISTVVAAQGQSLELDTHHQMALALQAELEAQEREEQACERARVAQEADAEIREELRFERAQMAWERAELVEHMQLDHGMDMAAIEAMIGPPLDMPIPDSCFANGMLVCDCEFPCTGNGGHVAGSPPQHHVPRTHGHGHGHPPRLSYAHGNGCRHRNGFGYDYSVGHGNPLNFNMGNGLMALPTMGPPTILGPVRSSQSQLPMWQQMQQRVGVGGLTVPIQRPPPTWAPLFALQQQLTRAQPGTVWTSMQSRVQAPAASVPMLVPAPGANAHFGWPPLIPTQVEVRIPAPPAQAQSPAQVYEVPDSTGLEDKAVTGVGVEVEGKAEAKLKKD